MKRYTIITKLLLLLITLACHGNFAEKEGLLRKPATQYDDSTQLQRVMRDKLQLVSIEDKKRIFDCLDDKRTPTPQPFRKYDRINYFSSKAEYNEKSGFLEIRDWPMFVSMQNYQNYKADQSNVFVTFRGMEWGVHKTPMSWYLNKILRPAYPGDILMMPDSYLYVNPKKNNIRKDELMALCHARTYSKKREISNYWPAFDDNGSWQLVDRFFPANENVYLIGWSNGSYPRSQFIETEKLDSQKFSFKGSHKLKKFLKAYKNRFGYTSNDYLRIRGILDIETNYSSKKPLWNLAKFLDEVVQNDDSVLYLGSCSLNMYNVRNYVKIIQMFDLKGKEMANGVIRYSNKRGNILIDILPLTGRGFYRFGSVDLVRQTTFTRNKNIKRRIRRNHNEMVGYTLRQFIKIMKERSQKLEI